ncbi:hypothetical protein [Lysobacter sp. CA199]|uniref:hypothetical protein n=1 Tax=Lysobacter sp. CA199 TaxID=3455608 RepID=UPI003F8D5306
MNAERIKRDGAVQVLALERDWARIAYMQFGQWLLGEQPKKPNLANTFAAHFPFFIRLDAAVADARTLQGDGLLQNFSVAELRKHVLPVRFLEIHAGVALDEGAKQEQVERSRIAEKLIAVRNTTSGALLKQYVDWLEHQVTPTRTIRLYLTAASQLCQAEGLAEGRPCSEEQLRWFLRKHPGARASLFRWLTFCRTALNWDIKMPPRATQKRREPRTVRELSVLLVKVNQIGVKNAPVAMLQRIIAKAFGFTIKRMGSNAWSIHTQEKDIYLSDEIESVRVPAQMQELVTIWMQRASKNAGIGPPTT